MILIYFLVNVLPVKHIHLCKYVIMYIFIDGKYRRMRMLSSERCKAPSSGWNETFEVPSIRQPVPTLRTALNDQLPGME